MSNENEIRSSSGGIANLTFDDRNGSQFDAFFTDAGRMTCVDDVGYIFIGFGCLFHYEFW